MKAFFSVVGVLLAALGLTAFWARHPDLLPTPPASVALWLSERYGAQDAEQVADLELLLMFGLSLLLVAALTWVVARLARRR